MNHHVVLEGPDGAGKTTLAKKLATTYGLAYHHEGPPPREDVLGHYARLLVEAKRPTIFDRFHLGETVYGPLLRGSSALDAYDLKLLDRLIAGMGTRVFVCLPPWHRCLAATGSKPELITDEVTFRKAYAAWTSVWSRGEYEHYDWSTHDLPELFTMPRLPKGHIGSLRPKVLIVGEQANGSLDVPFFGRGASSRWLNDTLATCLPERDFALVNAFDKYGRPNPLTQLATPVTVALGEVASNELTRQGRDHRRVPHPSYWKRFRYKEPEEYVDLIREACRAA